MRHRVSLRVKLGATIARRQEKNLAIAAGWMIAGSCGGALNQERCARLIPSRQIVEVFVLTIGHEVEHGFLRREQYGDATVQRRGNGLASRAIVGGGLFIERR